MKNIKILIWDLDGTLTRPSKRVEMVFAAKIFKKAAKYLNTDVKTAKKRFKKMVKTFKGSTLTLNKMGVPGFRAVAQIQNEIKWKKYIKQDDKLIKMFKNLKNYRHLLLTDNTKKAGEKKLKLLGLKPQIFEKKFFGIDLQITKPKLELFQKVLDYTKVSPSKHLMIGDMVQKDIIPAKKLGMKTCLAWSKSKHADISIKNIYQIEKLIKSKNE